MVRIQNFNEKLEGDLSRLSQEVKAERERREEGVPEREVLKRSIQSFSATVSSDEPPPEIPREEKSTILPDYVSGPETNPAVRLEVERLIKTVFNEGLEKAVREVRKHPPFVEDAFHDALIDKLLPEMEKRGLLK